MKGLKMFISIIKTVVIAFFIAVVILDSTANAQKTSLKPYGIKSGIIEYKYSGVRTGTSTLYFDDYGLKSAMKNNIKMEGKSENGWIISLKDEQYIFDPAKSNEGIKMKNPLLEGFFEMQQSDFDKFVEEFYTKMGYKKVGTEKYAGKDCIVYKGDLGKILIWNGILLYTESNFAGVYSKQETTSLKVNVPVDSKYFQIPKNIKFTEAPDLDDIDKMIEQESEDETE
jgi:hypothetical protein